MEMISIEKKEYDVIQRKLKELQKMKIEEKLFYCFSRMEKRKKENYEVQ